MALTKWTQWRGRELGRWEAVLAQILQNGDTGRYGDMDLPFSYVLRGCSLQHEEITVEDSAPADLPEHVQVICHSSSDHGSFTDAQKLQALRYVIADEEELVSSTATVFSGMACMRIFKYEYPDRLNNTIKTQIGVGIVADVHGDPASPDATFDIQFCPLKGGRAQTLSRPDTLYVNIDAARAYNLSFTIKKEKKRVLDISKGLPKDVMLVVLCSDHLHACNTFL